MNLTATYYLIKDQWEHKTLEKLEADPGKVIVVTGGSRGLGLSLVHRLLELEYSVIIGCRKVEEAKKNIKDLGDLPGRITVLTLDLQNPESVRSFAAEVRKQADEIEVLINNAGIMFGPYKETVDGFEAQFQTNYLSHFLLTSLLFDKIQKRIVNVSSCSYVPAYYTTDWNDLQKKDFYTPEGGYGTSKAAQILFTKFLQAKINDSPCYGDTDLSVFSLHPGMIYTDLYVHTPSFLFKPISNTLMKSKEQGAETILHAALSKELEGHGGAYTEKSSIVETTAFCSDLANQKKLWDMSLSYLNMDKFADGLE
uniref:Retinol dehydrogenase 11 n=1 Tax=Caligus clemensi TaxID=344056 RepID=C1C0D9_CALCM|nr:Retinol dehydrogenase 11 [Caligus clemensi]